jgi:hypothetical protein
MLYGFPIPYEDELFWSLLARYADRFRQRAQIALIEQAFGAATVTPTVDFPARLSFCASQLLPGHPCTGEIFLRQHTFFSWYAPFLPQHRAAGLRELMLGNGNSRAWRTAGLIAGKITVPPMLRYCPECFRGDLETYRELHWRRLHQFAGIEVCPVHHVLLEESSIARIKKRSRLKLEVPEKPLADVRHRHSENAALIRLAELGQQLLLTDWPTRGLEQLRAKHVQILTARDYANCGRTVRIDVRRLARDLDSFFPRDLLVRLGCDNARWIEELVRHNNSGQPPICHLLLITFLGVELDEFFAPTCENVRSPRQKPLNLTCGNTVCPNKNQPTSVFIHDNFSNALNGLVESYRCEVCGQVQQRCVSGYERVWVRDYGPLWKAELVSLWRNPRQGYREMSRILGRCADTIKSQAIKSGLPIPRPGQKRTSVQRFRHLFVSKMDVRLKKIRGLRKQWLKIRTRFPSTNARALRKSCPKIYATLYRYDRKWLLKNQPKGRRWWPKGVPRLDWAARDEALAQKIKLTAARLRSHLKPGERLTPSALARAVGFRGWLVHRFSKLPKCRAALILNADATVNYFSRHFQFGQEVDGVWFQTQAGLPEKEDGSAARLGPNGLVKDCEMIFLQVKTLDPGSGSARINI